VELDLTGCSSDDENSSNFSSEDVAEIPDEDDTSNAIPAITHSVILECMGSTKEREYKETLALAKRKWMRG